MSEETDKHVHAYEYLIELACNQNTPSWLSYIIYGMMAKHGSLSDEDLSKLAVGMENGKFLQFDEHLFDNVPRLGNVSNSFKLKKLIHHSGVNALATDTELRFCDDVTVVYGCNGSGKSGYFRVLNELSAGQIKHEILPNIYAEPSDISVHIDYEKEGHLLGFDWDGTRGAVSDLNSLFVFDSSYADELLDRRSLSLTAVEPFGLQMFRAVTEKIDVFKGIVNGHISELRRKLPVLDVQSLAPDIQVMLNDENQLTKGFNGIIKKTVFTPAEHESLKAISSQIKNLQVQDTSALVRHKSALQAALRTFLSRVQQEVQWLNATILDWNKKLSHYASTYENAQQARNQYVVLKDIPGSDSREWKDFIELGVKYTSHHSEYYDKKCPYCHQPIIETKTLELLQSYVKFLADTTQQECSSEWLRLDMFRKSIQKKSVMPPNLDNYRVELEAINDGMAEDGKTPKSLYDSIEQICTLLLGYKKSIDEKTDKLESLDETVIKVNHFEQAITTLVDQLESERQKLSCDMGARQTEIQKLSAQRKVLEQRQSLVAMKPQIEELYTALLKIHHLETFCNSISSRKVSDLSRIAHEHLLTNNLKTRFSYWLGKFDFPDLKVVLDVPSIIKGAPITELHLLKGNRSIQSVLSEGEQKAVSLAMFLTEAELSRANVPLVFDDPVNSLDNRVIEQFAQMLMELNQQVIVFTHNRLFLDALQVPSQPNLWHICKNYNNGCSSSAGKHIYLWETEAFEGRTGLITQMKGDSAEAILDRVHDKLAAGILDADQKLSVAANLRKAIEKLIDERLLKNVQPCRFNVSRNCINWQLLASLNADPTYQQQHSVLQREFGRLSNRRLHEGASSREKPLTQSDLQSICDNLLRIKK